MSLLALWAQCGCVITRISFSKCPDARVWATPPDLFLKMEITVGGDDKHHLDTHCTHLVSAEPALRSGGRLWHRAFGHADSKDVSGNSEGSICPPDILQGDERLEEPRQTQPLSLCECLPETMELHPKQAKIWVVSHGITKFSQIPLYIGTNILH